MIDTDKLSYEGIILLLIAVLSFLVFIYVTVSGLFAKVTVSTCETKYGPMVVAYKTMTGPYKEAGALFTESYRLLPKREQVGIYYDDPEAVPAHQLRFAVGPILSIGDKVPHKEELDKVRSHGFRIFHFPKANYVVTASFPFRTTLSIFIGIYRVYPKLRSYIAQRNLCAYPAIEVYMDNEIIFIMPLSRQEEFFVPEFLEEDISVATTDIGSVTGDRDAPHRDDDVFLKPRTPLRVNQRRISDDRSSKLADSEASDGKDSEHEDDVMETSSFDDLTELDESVRKS